MSRVGGRLMFSETERCGLYREPMGLAQAHTEVRALSVEMSPALATDTVWGKGGAKLEAWKLSGGGKMP